LAIRPRLAFFKSGQHGETDKLSTSAARNSRVVAERLIRRERKTIVFYNGGFFVVQRLFKISFLS
jgi:hypothetical protein